MGGRRRGDDSRLRDRSWHFARSRCARFFRCGRFQWNYARVGATCELKLIETLVGQCHQRALLVSILRMNGNAKIHGGTNFEFQRPDLSFILSANAATQSDGLLRVSLRQQQSEFVAADAKRKIGSAHRLAKRGGCELQHLIALQMTAAIIHFFQFVKIQDDDRQMLAVSFRAIQFLLEVFVE